MQLTVFNGSPRGKKSNTKILMDHFIRGMNQDQENEVEIAYLIHTKDAARNAELFSRSENVIIAFPLYTDCMPGIVKHFFEALSPYCGGKNNPSLGFIVQSGFSEPIHSRFVEKYLVKLTRRLECEYSGTVVKGGVEGIQIMPPWMTKKLFETFFQLGVHYAGNNVFDPELLDRLAPRDRMSFAKTQLLRLMGKTGLSNFYWNSQLKDNGVYDQRFDRPFQ